MGGHGGGIRGGWGRVENGSRTMLWQERKSKGVLWEWVGQGGERVTDNVVAGKEE